MEKKIVENQEVNFFRVTFYALHDGYSKKFT